MRQSTQIEIRRREDQGVDRCHPGAETFAQKGRIPGCGSYISENMTSVKAGGIVSPTFDPRSRSGKADRIMCNPSQKYVSGPTCSTR